MPKDQFSPSAPPACAATPATLPAPAPQSPQRLPLRLATLSLLACSVAFAAQPQPAKASDAPADAPAAAIALSGTRIGSGVLRLQWQQPEGGQRPKAYGIYRSAQPFSRTDETGVEKIASVKGSETEKLLYPLIPGERYYYGVSAEFASDTAQQDQGQEVIAFAHTAPGPVDAEVFGDMLAINHFWGGGGARRTKRTAEWETVALDLLAQTPFKEIRWWRNYPDVIEKFYQRGIGATTFASAGNFPDAEKLGIYLFGSINEPHLTGRSPEQYAAEHRKIAEGVRAASPHNRIYAPVVGLDRHSLDYIERFYAAGGKDDFDVFDLHTYLGYTTDFTYPEGYPYGSPEALFERIETIRAIMARYGDADKPMISTEYGFTDCNEANPVGYMTPTRKADFLVRGLIIHNVLGFRRVFVYSFWDEGDDPSYTEHHFGLVDYNLQKKPAFYAMQVLGSELGDTVYQQPMQGADDLNYGYVYRDRDSDSGNHVTAVWNGAQEQSGTFRTAPGAVEIVSMLGERRSVQTAADGTFRVRYGSSPVYLKSSQPVERVSSRSIGAGATSAATNADAAQGVTLAMEKDVLIVPPAQDVPIAFTLQNPKAEALEIHTELQSADGIRLAAETIRVPAGQSVSHSFPLPAATQGKVLDRYRILINYEDEYETRADGQTVFIRRLHPAHGLHTAQMEGYEHPVYLLVDDTLEITVDPMRGGRILEMIDRRTLQNQVTITYERLGELGSIAFFWCIWDEVRAPGQLRINRNTPYQAEPLENGNGLRLRAGEQGKLQIEKILRLSGNGVFEHDTTVTNTGTEPTRFSYYLHPEYTVGGSADSHSDYLQLPIGGQDVTIPFWTGLGDRPTPPFTGGYWILRDPVAGYQIRQDFSLDEFRSPRLWFGIGCANLEMESPRDLELAPEQSWNGKLRWTFSLGQ